MSIKITKEVIDQFSNQIKTAVDIIFDFSPNSLNLIKKQEYWQTTLTEIGLRCVAISIKLDKGIIHRQDEDQQIVDQIPKILELFAKDLEECFELEFSPVGLYNHNFYN